jgi:phosphomannomutase
VSKIKFGTDGWRAIISDDFTYENVRIVAQSIADYVKSLKKKITNRKASSTAVKIRSRCVV